MKTAGTETTAQRLISKRAGTTGYEVYLEGTTNYVSAFIANTSGTFFSGEGVRNVRDTQWHHVVAIINRTGNTFLSIYIDGVRDLAPLNNGNVMGSIATSADLSIGKFSTTQYFNGTIDEVKFWNRILSPKKSTPPTLQESGSYTAFHFVVFRNIHCKACRGSGWKLNNTEEDVHRMQSLLCLLY